VLAARFASAASLFGSELQNLQGTTTLRGDKSLPQKTRNTKSEEVVMSPGKAFQLVLVRILRPFALALLLVCGISPVLQARPLAITVTNTNDLGPGSLRQAILDANASPGTDEIVFDLSGCPCTITLASQLPNVSEDLVVSGPGAASLTISGNDTVRVLRVDSGITLALQDLTVANGNAAGNGGGVYNEGTLTVNSTVFADNVAINSSPNDGQGGGIYNHGGTVSVTDSTFSDNRATQTGVSPVGFGGGIYSDGVLTVVGSTFVENEAHSWTGYGGGMWISGTVAITNSTFFSNTTLPATAIGVGGAIFLERGTLDILHTTFSGNIADDGGGIFNNSGTVTLRNTIVANSVGGNCSGTTTDGGGNLQFGDTTCGGGTIPTGDPNLASLADNSGSTQTMAPQEGSAAIDACACAGVATDQRGRPRPTDIPGVANTGDGCDIGAHEVQLHIYLPLIMRNS
jgi:hypothetical protein